MRSSTGASAPVTPGRDQAREWLARELAGREYREEQGAWLQRAWDWVLEKLEGVGVPGLGTSWSSVVVVVLLLAAVAAAVLLVSGPIRRVARDDGAAGVFEAGPRSSAEHGAQADAHAAAGQWALAVQERFRALVRSLEERDLIDRRPGRTAHEVAREASTPLPGCAAGLARAARTFDDVRYGGRPASAETDQELRAVAAAVAASRPELPAASPAGTGGGS